MSEKIHTPSDIFSESSHKADKVSFSNTKGRLESLFSETAAHAAKPFMDVAVDLFDAVGDANEAQGVDRNLMDVTDSVVGYQDLINFAEQRARNATRDQKVPELTQNEENVLDVFSAAIEVRQASTKVDMGEASDPDSMDAAIDEAEDRKEASTNREEKIRWSDMVSRLDDYRAYMDGRAENNPRIQQEFQANTANAGYFLKRAKGREMKDSYEPSGPTMKNVLFDAKALRAQADMLTFLGEIYPVDGGQAAKPEAQPKAKEADTTAEHQMNPEKAILDDVLAAAKNNVIIHTDAPSKVTVRVGDRHVDLGGKGFSNFGSRAGSETAQREGILAGGFGTPESVQFQRTKTEQVFEQREVSLGRFKGTTMQNVYVGAKQVAMPDVINPKTGQQEPGVVFRYRFSGQSIGDEYPADAPAYATNGGRPGNQLEVETILPQSTANELEQMIRENPKLVRELAHKLVTTEGDVPEDIWLGTRANSASYSSHKTVAAMRPPYEQLPNDWKVALWGDTTLKGNSELYTNLAAN